MFSKSNLDDDNDCDRSSRTLRCTPTICRKLPSTSDILRSVIFPTLQSRRIRKNLRFIEFLKIEKKFNTFLKTNFSADSSWGSIFQLLLWNTTNELWQKDADILAAVCQTSVSKNSYGNQTWRRDLFSFSRDKKRLESSQVSLADWHYLSQSKPGKGSIGVTLGRLAD